MIIFFYPRVMPLRHMANTYLVDMGFDLFLHRL